MSAAIQLVDSIPEAQLVVFTRRGYMPVQAALLRPLSNIHAFAPNNATCRKVVLARGVTARQIDYNTDFDDLVARAVQRLKDDCVVKYNAPQVVISDIGQRGEVVDSILLIHA